MGVVFTTDEETIRHLVSCPEASREEMVNLKPHTLRDVPDLVLWLRASSRSHVLTGSRSLAFCPSLVVLRTH